MARFYPLYEVQKDAKPNEWILCFQYGEYDHNDSGNKTTGYRFIYRKPNGTLLSRGQAVIPSMADAMDLMAKAMKAGWGNH